MASPSWSRDPAVATADDDVEAEFRALLQRAADRGHSLDPPPVLEVATNPRHGSRVVLGSSGHPAPRVRLAADLAAATPQLRRWSMAHELSHVLRRQQGVRPDRPAPLLAAAAVAAVVAIAGVVGAGWLVVVDQLATSRVLFAAAVVGLAGLWLVLLALTRQEEAATDATAAAVFGEGLTPAGVQRLRRREGVLSRWVPTVLRSHPHPHRRVHDVATDGRLPVQIGAPRREA